jgi:hypothetical protein
VPVEVVATPNERLPDAVEAAAYFVVSECLANIGKHAEATEAAVAVRSDGRHLTVVVADDGRGGAELDGGSGIQGLLDRVGALSGTLSVESPPGRGTTVEASIPLTEEAADAATLQRHAPVVLSDEDAARLQSARKRRLAFRLASLGIVAGVLVAIWAFTDPGLPWIAWPLLALGLIGGLDAWHVFATPPLSQTDVTAAEGADVEERLRRVTRRRGVRHQVGAHVILNVFIVGVWLAANGTYFWPAWVMLGSAVAIALKALPRGARAHTHLLGDHP